jgi:hypothetical protein
MAIESVAILKFGIWFLFQSWDKIAFVVGVLAVWLAFQMGREKLRVYRSRSWPTCAGAVEKLAVRKVDGGLNGVDYWKITFDFCYQVEAEHTGSYAFNCTSESMANGAMAGLAGKNVSVHYPKSAPAKGIVWEDEIWDVWWDTYWLLSHPAVEAD